MSKELTTKFEQTWLTMPVQDNYTRTLIAIIGGLNAKYKEVTKDSWCEVENEETMAYKKCISRLCKALYVPNSDLNIEDLEIELESVARGINDIEASVIKWFSVFNKRANIKELRINIFGVTPSCTWVQESIAQSLLRKWFDIHVTIDQL